MYHSLRSGTWQAKQATNLVMGDGNINADIVLIGEAPGKKEDETGLPFVGAAGKFLNEMLASAGMVRSDVYITNIVKDRPQENRDPTTEEIEIYGPFLDRQVEILQPKVICALGRYSMGYIMEKFGLKANLERGQPFMLNCQ